MPQENATSLTEAEKEEVAARSSPRAVLIHEIVRQEGEQEVGRSVPALAWSGLAAGLSMGFSFLTMAMMRSYLPDAAWRPLVAALGYSVGFLIVVLGQQQLFTESTLTALLPFLTRRTAAAFRGTARVWTVVLCANLVGTWLFAFAIAHEGIFDEAMWRALGEVAQGSVDNAFGPAMLKAILAGWLIALMVWLLPSAGSARLFIILILTYVVALGSMPHIIAGSVEGAFAVITGTASPLQYLGHFLMPALIGNTIGGVSLVGLLNHAPIAPEVTKRG